ncbi:MAG: CRISPR-associated endonuclease Cas2 [Desulfobulbus sp.]|jgi:CRISPR-associated protein Cas2|nr:CRISPR-associated endonuclease Cas2 [Desulfobulbus sp.]
MRTQLYIVCFDVRDRVRLRRVADALENFGTRVQRSLFECHLDARHLDLLQERLAALIDEKYDQVRYYPLCRKDTSAILVDGPGKRTRDADYFLI